MKKTLIYLLGFIFAPAFVSCLSDEEKLWNDYKDWRAANDNWLDEQIQTGKYQEFVPQWNQDLNVRMRWLNDRSKTEGNLTPIYTSSVAVKYKGWLYDGTPFDSSYLATDSIVTMTQSGLIPGWVIALEQMKVGDKVELLVPYESGYGSSSLGKILPYSVLRFEIELRDIPAYEIKP
ncbi:MAG: FKBP-type peptidyl-prolyl cis-trans isomerase [Muribaculaceae bacterium]|nr:FKBP-type peptidyl-prolyl cis-trans isomerase [Muribaculaceae bacterium]